MPPLPESFYLGDTVAIARALVGKYLVRASGGVTLAVRIAETEAYLAARDKACHAYGGRRTARNEVMYGPPGRAYIYFTYGMHHMLNLVTGSEGTASAVLVRGALPVLGVDEIARRRFGRVMGELSAYQRRNLLNGPGKLCQALGLTRSENGLPLSGPGLWVAEALPEFGLAAPEPVGPIRTGRRVGIAYAQEAAEFPWRFWLAEGYTEGKAR